MNLIVADAEFTGTASDIANAIDALVSIGNQFLSKLDKLTSMGYSSDAMATAIAENRAIVQSSLDTFLSASDPLTTNINSFVSTINDIDHI